MIRANKKVFWISAALLLLSLILIIIGSVYGKDLMLNIGVSTVSGSIISLVATYINIYHKRKDYECEFYNISLDYYNYLIKIVNWYKRRFKFIKYPVHVLKSEQLENPELELYIECQNNECDNIVKQFVEIIDGFYDLCKFNYILDDYRGLITCKKNKTRNMMFELRNEFAKYDLVYMDEMQSDYSNYKLGVLPEIALFNAVIIEYKNNTKISGDCLNIIIDLINKFINESGIKNYVNKFLPKKTA